MIKKYTPVAYFLFTMLLTYNTISACLSPQKLTQKCHAAGYGRFIDVTGLLNKIKTNDTQEAVAAKVAFATTFYAQFLATGNELPETIHIIENRRKHILRILEQR
jgi:hypothetical protein